MCGIAGIFSFTEKGAESLQKINSSLSCLSARGPDSANVFRHHNVALAHTRLSIIDTSEAGNQPMTDPSGRYTIIYNGEIYNFKELRENLSAKGVQFISHTDTEVLLQLYIHYGEECLQKINGFFAFAIYDNKEENLFIARDRIGIKPLLFYKDEDKLIFGSEMKALMALGTPKEMDSTSLYQYLQLNYIPGPSSIFKNVQKLLPGYFLTVDSQQSTINSQYYFRLPTSPDSYRDFRPSYSQAKQTLQEKLESSVQKRLIADVPLGAFLSGGIDSSIIVALASRHTQHLNTFSIGFKDEPFFDETYYANLVAKKFNTNHTVFSLSTDDLFEHLFDVLDYIDEPFADSSALPVYILSKHTRKHVKVALSGDGADELFAGYNKYRGEYFVRKNAWIKSFSLLQPLIKQLPQSRNSKFGNKARQLNRLIEGAKMSAKDRYWRWCSITDEKEAAQLLSFCHSERSETERTCLAGRQGIFLKSKEYLERKNHFTHPITENGSLNEILLADQHLVLPNDMLTKVDLMSMANGLEVRVPFLDHEVVEFVNSLPSEYKINSKMRKRILQDTFRNILPAELYSRPKQGFEVPLLRWFRTELKDLILNDLLADDFIKEQGIFNLTEIQKLKKKLFSNSPGDVQAQIWALVVFQYWWRKYLL